MFLVLAWAIPFRFPWGALPWTGWALLAMAALLFASAAFEFARARTTIIPHRYPSRLITTGVFGLTRNPIYLADLLILAGVSLLMGWPQGLVLVPVLGWILSRRFIRPEEARLRETFGEAFEDYAERTRRWI